MARLIINIRNNFEKDQKMIVWAHNVHIAKSEFVMTGEAAFINGMGVHLYKEYGNGMKAIGAAFNRGYFEINDRMIEPATKESLDGTFSQLNKEMFLLNLHTLTENPGANTWLNEKKVIRGQDFEMTCIPLQAFDAFFYTDQISRVKTNPGSASKLFR
jgi:erythromycin esterase-like protein